MKRICFVIDRLDIGGAERVAVTTAQRLAAMGHRITFVTIDDIVRIHLPDAFVYHTLAFRGGFAKYMRNRRRMYTLLDRLQAEDGTFDLIFVHLFKATRVMQHYPHPCIYHVVHSTQSRSALKDKKGLSRTRARLKIKRGYDDQHLICVSEGIERDLLETMQVRPHSIRTIYNPFDIEAIRQKGDIPVSLPFDDPYLIFVGRLVPEKRVDYLLDAYAKSGVDASLLIVGDGELREPLQRHAADLGIRNDVVFIGAVDNPYPYMARASLLVLCSHYEGFGAVLVESLIVGTPALSTNCPSGPSEILTRYTTDALVRDNDDNDALATGIARWQELPAVDENAMDCFSDREIAAAYLELCRQTDR